MKFFNFILCTVCSFVGYAQASPNNNKDISQTGTIACEKIIRAYPALRDNGPIKEYGELFTQEALFQVKKMNILLQGRDEITKRLESALKSTKTLHVITSVNIDQVSDNTYKSNANFTINFQKLPQQQFPSITIKGYYDDLLEFDGKRCMIVSRQVIIESQQP